ncbi:MAG: hypothetical protein M1153_00845 [Patescibacteria group bacterium]|nr:hypothetical protein [Patescibacteria group bacterium]
MSDVEPTNNEHLIPEIDRDFLREKEYEFLVVRESGSFHLIIKNFSFPEAYAPTIADLLIILPAGYPNAALDMFWTRPDVKLASGSFPEKSDVHKDYRGESWQRWSRHFHAECPWRVGKDNIRTFIAAIKRELDKKR